MMAWIKKNRVALIISVVITALYFFLSDWMTQFLEQSACFHGVMVAVGVVALPLLLLLAVVDKDTRPFPPGARWPRILNGLFFFCLLAGMIFWGLGFWYPVSRVIGYWLVGAAMVLALLLVVLILRADRANAKAKKDKNAPAA